MCQTPQFGTNYSNLESNNKGIEFGFFSQIIFVNTNIKAMYTMIDILRAIASNAFNQSIHKIELKLHFIQNHFKVNFKTQ